MTDDIDAEAEALARYESGRPMPSGHFDDPPDPTMLGAVADRPVVELVLALVDDDGRVDGNPTRPGSPCATTMGLRRGRPRRRDDAPGGSDSASRSAPGEPLGP
jgi:hypothetical protein